MFNNACSVLALVSTSHGEPAPVTSCDSEQTEQRLRERKDDEEAERRVTTIQLTTRSAGNG